MAHLSRSASYHTPTGRALLTPPASHAAVTSTTASGSPSVSGWSRYVLLPSVFVGVARWTNEALLVAPAEAALVGRVVVSGVMLSVWTAVALNPGRGSWSA